MEMKTAGQMSRIAVNEAVITAGDDNKEIALASTFLHLATGRRISSHHLLSCARSCVLIFTVTAHRSLYLQWPVVFKTLHPQRVRALVRIAFTLR